jgi:peptidoglycan/LPS O-acetylase OafA/YrhL
VEKEGKVKWYLRPLGVVLLLFFVLGPFGLPLLYKSPKFSKKLKILLTIAVMIYTAYLISATIEIARKVYMRMEENQYILK